MAKGPSDDQMRVLQRLLREGKIKQSDIDNVQDTPRGRVTAILSSLLSDTPRDPQRAAMGKTSAEQELQKVNAGGFKPGDWVYTYRGSVRSAKPKQIEEITTNGSLKLVGNKKPYRVDRLKKVQDVEASNSGALK
jgi:hypothetical protein